METGLADIDLLLLDVDGVLTNGDITYSDTGEQIKSFHSRDGLGLRPLMDSGIGSASLPAANQRLWNTGVKILGSPYYLTVSRINQRPLKKLFYRREPRLKKLLLPEMI